MPVIYGETGPKEGNPTCLREEDLQPFRIYGNVLFRIGSGDGGSLEWKCLPGESAESLDSSVRHQDHPVIAPRSGELPTGTSPNWPAIDTESACDSRRDNPNRLTGLIQFVLQLLEFWRLGTHEAVRLLGFDPADTDHVAAVLEGNEQFRGRDVRD